MGGLLDSIGQNRRVQEIVISWFAPLLMGSFIFVIVILPDVRASPVVAHVASALAALHVNRFLFIFIAALATACLLYMSWLFLFSFLEGYTWPGVVARWRIERAHVPQRDWLEANPNPERAQLAVGRAGRQLKTARSGGAPSAEAERLEQALSKAEDDERGWLSELRRRDASRHKRNRSRKYPRGLGWLPRSHRPLFTPGRPSGGDGEWAPPYPASAGKMLPTQLGNAMRVMETYGSATYGLDSQMMWFELFSEASASLQSILEDLQYETETLDSGNYTAIALAAAAVTGGIWRATAGTWDLKLWLTAVVSLIAAEIFYRRLLSSVDGWAVAVRALVNTVRDPLREKYGLRRPTSNDDEKRMWSALTGAIIYGYDPEREKVLADYRITGGKACSANQGATSADGSHVTGAEGSR